MNHKALLIGVNIYVHSGYRNLTAVPNDIEYIYQILSNSTLQYQPKILEGRNASKANITEALNCFFDCDDNDVLFLYWSGHGTSKNLYSESNLIAYDTNPAQESNTAISMKSIAEIIEKSKSYALVVVLDSCHSGAIARGAIDFQLNISGEGKATMASCTYFEKSYESPEIGQGHFTHCFIKGLGGEAALPNGKVTVNSLHDYICSEIKKITPHNKKQTPVLKANMTDHLVLNEIEPINSINRNEEQMQNIIDKSPQRNKPIFSFPYSENAYFTGREEKLKLIYDNFHDISNARHLKQMQAIRGLGGIGKTSIALKYAYSHRAEYEVVWWINAENPGSIILSYRDFLREMGLFSDDMDDKIVLKEMRDWFLFNDNWLFIYDNADENDYNIWLEKHLPQVRDKKNGHVLITTRSYSFINCETVDIGVFTVEESISFLQLRVRKKGNGYSDNDAQILADHLQYLPLALEQAGAYMRSTPGVIYSDYVNLFHECGVEIFGKHSSNTSFGYTSTVTITWKISMDKIMNKGARQLFNMCAYLAPDAIPVDMFIRGKEALPNILQKNIISPGHRNEILSDLVKYSLVSDSRNENILSDEKRLLSIHRLLQEVVQGSFKSNTKWLEYCIDLISSVSIWNPREKNSIANFRTDLSHAINVAKSSRKHLKGCIEKSTQVSGIFFMTGAMCAMSHDIENAISCLNECIEMFENLSKENKSKISEYNSFSSYVNRAAVYTSIKEYEKAVEDCCKGILIGKRLLDQGYEVVQGVQGDTSIQYELAKAYMNRGVIYENLQMHEEALSDKNISVEIYEKLINSENFTNENDIALAYMNRSATYRSLNMNDAAQDDIIKCINIWERMKSDGEIIFENDLAKARINKAMLESMGVLESSKNQFATDGKSKFLGNMLKVHKQKK